MRPDEFETPARCAHLSRDGRGYPVLATIPQDDESIDFGAISEKRKLVVATYDVCAVCAQPFGNELRWVVTGNRDWMHYATSTLDSIEAPIHEICALYAAQVCPFVSSPFSRLGDEHRRGQLRPDALVLVGFERTTEVKAVESPIQRGTFVLSFSLTKGARAHVLDGRAESRAAYANALSEEVPLALDEHEQRIIDLLTAQTPDGEDSGGVMAGGAWYIGAAFCPRAGRVSGLKYFAKPGGSYVQISAAFLRDPQRMADFEDAKDPATAAAVRWFQSRRRLPAVLSKWRADERIRIKRAGQSEQSSGRGRSTSKRRRSKASRRTK